MYTKRFFHFQIFSFTFILCTMPLKKISILCIPFTLCVKCKRYFTVLFLFLYRFLIVVFFSYFSFMNMSSNACIVRKANSFIINMLQMNVCATAVVYVTINEGGLFKSIVPGHRFNTLQQSRKFAWGADWEVGAFSRLKRLLHTDANLSDWLQTFFKSVFYTRLFQVRRVKSIEFPTDFSLRHLYTRLKCNKVNLQISIAQ